MLLDGGLALYRQGELLAALAEWEHALEIDPSCTQARQYIDFVKKNFDLLNERFHLDDQGSAPASDTSFAIESTESVSQTERLIDASAVRPDRHGEARDAAAMDGWPVGLPGARSKPVEQADASPPGTRSGPMKKLDPARLAEVLPSPEDDDLLALANASRSVDVPFDLALPLPARHKEPETGPVREASAAPAPSAASPLLSPDGPARSRGKQRSTMTRDLEDSENEKTTERQHFVRSPQARLDDQRTPLPELPGEGAFTVGASPDLDDAWTLDLDLDASSWGSPGSASVPTARPVTPASSPERPAVKKTSPAATGPIARSRGESKATVPDRPKSSFAVEALTGPGTSAHLVTPIVIEETEPVPVAPLQLDDLDDDSNELGSFTREPAAPDQGAPANRDVAHPDSARRSAVSPSDAVVELDFDAFDSLTPQPGAPGAAPSTSPIDTGDLELGAFDGNAVAKSEAAATTASRNTEQKPTESRLSYPSLSPLESLASDLLGEVDRGAAPGESARDRLRRRITALIERAKEEHATGNHTAAVIALDLAIAEDPDSAIGQKLIQLHRETMCEIFQTFLGDAGRVPVLAMSMNQLASEKIESRAAFLLSRVDGFLTIDELLDVSGMSRVEAYRHLCILTLKGILKIDS